MSNYISSVFKAAPELFLNKLWKSNNASVDYNRTEECMCCTKTLCDIDGCHQNGHEEPALLQCGHIIGKDCADTWYSEHQTCPMCRADAWKTPGPKGFYF